MRSRSSRRWRATPSRRSCCHRIRIPARLTPRAARGQRTATTHHRSRRCTMSRPMPSTGAPASRARSAARHWLRRRRPWLCDVWKHPVLLKVSAQPGSSCVSLVALRSRSFLLSISSRSLLLDRFVSLICSWRSFGRPPVSDRSPVWRRKLSAQRSVVRGSLSARDLVLIVTEDVRRSKAPDLYLFLNCSQLHMEPDKHRTKRRTYHIVVERAKPWLIALIGCDHSHGAAAPPASMRIPTSRKGQFGG